MLDSYGLEKLDFFRYLQIRSYFNDEIKPTEECERNLIYLFIDMYKKMTIGNLFTFNKKHSTDKFRLKWEKESGTVITEEEWLNSCSVQSTSTHSGLWRDFCWQNLVRYFITPKLKCVQTGETVRGPCWRNCGEQLADHFHIFWSRPAIQPYWQEIIQVIQNKF